MKTLVHASLAVVPWVAVTLMLRWLISIEGWLVLMGIISILINLTWFSAVRWTTATNVGMLIRFDVVFVVLIGSLFGLENHEQTARSSQLVEDVARASA